MKKMYLLFFLIFFLLLMPNVYASEIKTGTYKIHSINDERIILVENNGNIELGNNNSNGVTTWIIYSDGENFSIRSSADQSISLTIDSENIENGSNIITSNFENSNNQKFKFVHTENKKYYYIRSTLGNYNLDVTAGIIEDGTNIQLYNHNGTNAQMWKLERIDEVEQVIEDGTYTIRAKNNTNNVIDLIGAYTNNNSNIQIYENNSTSAQLWNIKFENGYYKIYTVLDNNKCLDIQDEKFKSGSNIQLYQSKNINAQKWIIILNEDNTYSFYSYDGLWVIDISEGSTASGANIQLYQTNGTIAQKFSLENKNNNNNSENSNENNNTTELLLGTYKIHSANNENKIIVENEGNIELGDNNSTGITTWKIYSNGDSFYIKSSEDPSISLSIDTGSIRSGSNIKTSNFNNDNYHKFKFVHTENKQSYYIKAVTGNYNLDIVSENNIQLSTHNGTTSQMWKLERLNEVEQIIENGIYTIRAKNNTNNAIDLSGANTNNNSNIQVYSDNSTFAQLWNIKFENGYYKIYTAINDDKCLDIQDEIFKSGSNIQLYQSKNINAQKWIIRRNDDNSYSFYSYDGLWVIDISGGSTSSGANIQLYQSNGTIAQKFSLEKSNIEFLESGYYTIESLLGTDMIIGINDTQVVNQKNVILTNSNDNKYNKWYVSRVKEDIYVIANAANKKKVLDVAGGFTAARSNVQLYQKNDTNAQKWRIQKNGDNYSIIGVGSGKALDVQGASSSNGTNIQIYDFNNTNAQIFKLVPTTINEYETIGTGKYLIKSNQAQDKVVDVREAIKDNNTNVWLYSINNTNAQIWKIESIGEEEHLIKSMMNPNTVLTASSSNVVLRKYDGSDDQKWYFMYNNNGELIILNIGTGKYLNFEGTASETNVSLSETQTESNEVLLSSYNETLKYRGIDVSSHNGDIDWDGIKNTIDFAIIRAGYSSEVLEGNKDRFQDSKFLRNVEACERLNIPYALYLYSYALSVDEGENSSVNEANHMLKLIEKANDYGSPNLSVPIYYDLEDESTFNAVNYDATTLTNMNDRFCSIIEENGYQCGLYTFLYGFDYMGYENVRNLASKYSIWVARWYWTDFHADEYQFPAINEDKSGFESRFNVKHKIWQFSSEGNIPGANTGSGRIDLNIGYDIFE